ncbi:AGE family epimerase/isomerase [Sphingomonas sp. 1P08PE]|uniref:AGE family epimerase/isomerase n=1 Tax=Sphingomonas sp. 1P08PE TaxID=554122 RepID=UPI00399FCEB5
MASARAELETGYRGLKDWALGSAAPLWAQKGVDRVRGSFVERLDHDCRELVVPRRARLVARQIYSFATLERLGWRGTDDLVAFGFDALTAGFAMADGEVVPERTPEGTVARRMHDLYDVAFVLFALATVATRHTDRHRSIILATAIRTRLEAHRHDRGGFEAGLAGALPLEANPHMHLMEASLAWAAIPGVDAGWNALADEIATLCLHRFIDAKTGRLREFYDADWHPMAGDAGRIVEPGHQFEWAWLLTRWGMARERPDALAVARRLVHGAEREGVDRRGIAFNALNDDGTLRDGNARLWPQTERIKGWIALAAAASDTDAREVAERQVAAAMRGLNRFLDTRMPGLWFETIGVDDRPREEEVRASSLYHILCALDEVDRYIVLSDACVVAPDQP